MANEQSASDAITEWRQKFCARPIEMQILQTAFESVAGPTAGPQVVALVGESGLGKTRLVQEFYKWLALTKDTDGLGYWPKRLNQFGATLQVNPEIELCEPSYRPRYFWWGFRLAVPEQQNSLLLSSLSNARDHFLAHLNHIINERLSVGDTKQRWKLFQDWLVDVGAEAFSAMVPGIGLFKSTVKTVFAFKKLDEEAEDRALTPREARDNRLRDVSDEYFACLIGLYGSGDAATLPHVPLIFVIDDAQWLSSDPALHEFVDGLLRRAYRWNWPLLLVATHWQKEWNEGSALSLLIARHVSSDWQPLLLGPLADLGMLVRTAFPGLPETQISELQAKASGNPLMLDQLMLELYEKPRYFENLDQRGRLKDAALKELRDCKLHQLITARMNTAPEIRDTLAISAVQGARFLTSLSNEAAATLKLPLLAANAIAAAENPWAFVQRFGPDAAEFTQRIYQDVARGLIPDIVSDSAKVQDALALAVMARFDARLMVAERDLDLFLDVTQRLLSHDPAPVRRQIAGKALTEIVVRATAAYDLRTALNAALAFARGCEADLWRLADFSIAECLLVLGALRSFDERDSSMQRMAEAVLVRAREAVEADASELTLRELAMTLVRVGSIRVAERGVATEDLYAESVILSRKIADGWPSVETKRDLLVALDRVGGATFLHEALGIATDLVRAGPSHQARLDLAVCYARIADLTPRAWRKRSYTDEERSYTDHSLSIVEHLALETHAPSVMRLLSYALVRKAEHVNPDAARSLFERAVLISRGLVAKLKTPGADRDLLLVLRGYSDFTRIYDRREANEITLEAIELATSSAATWKTNEAQTNLLAVLVDAAIEAEMLDERRQLLVKAVESLQGRDVLAAADVNWLEAALAEGDWISVGRFLAKFVNRVSEHMSVRIDSRLRRLGGGSG